MTLRLLAPAQSFIQRVGVAIDVAGLQATLHPRGVDLDGEADAVVHRCGERLGSPHAAEATRQHEPAGQRACEVPTRHGPERLVGALQNALGTDVDPRTGGHLAVHDQALALELAKHIPGRPPSHQVRVGNQHPRSLEVRGEYADRLAGLHQERLVVVEREQRAADRVECRPIARRLPGAAVHHEVLRPLGDVRVEVVHQHAQRGLLDPALARPRRSARRSDGPGAAHGSRTFMAPPDPIAPHGSQR